MSSTGGLGGGAPSGGTPAGGAPDEEGLLSALEGAIVGDFSDNSTWSRVGGQTVVGFIPIVGQIADARDTLAAIKGIWDGKDGAWGDLGLAAIAWVPGVGDLAKGAFRVGKKAAKVAGDATPLVKGADEVAGGVKAASRLVPDIKRGISGRLESASAKLEPQHIGTGTPTTEAAREYARKMGKPTDDAGHAIGENLGGPGGVNSGNIFPFNPTVNRGAFAQFEKQIAREVAAGKNVFVNVVPKYAGEATRPFEVVYNVTVDGKTITRTFPNP